MKGFGGFLARGRLVKVPALFFSELLPAIDHLAEMKVTLYCIWRLQAAGQPPYLWEREMAQDELFMQGLGARLEDQLAALREGVERAVARGTLLRVEVKGPRGAEGLILVNTPRGQAMAQGAESGRWQPGDSPQALIGLSVERPNVFTLYEQNVGPLTPLIGEKLKDLESAYPAEWIAEAVEIAVQRNKRSLGYIEGILKKWQDNGRDEPEDHGAVKRFTTGKYGDDILH